MSSAEKNPAIVVAAYNREQSLLRLLASLEQAEYPDSAVTLVISIDKSENNAIVQAAEAFQWTHGEKRIIHHLQQLGLREHILRCGDLTAEYGSIILFEDDLFASKYFYQFTADALRYYCEENQVAGISLYSYDISENWFNPFSAVDDGNDVYFMQVASSWGQAWTSEQWQGFRNWFSEHPEINEQEKPPAYLLKWTASSWKRHYIRYLHFTEKFFVYPRHSYSTNFEEPGATTQTKGIYQVALQQGKRDYKLIPLSESRSVYDAYFEMTAACLKKWNPQLKEYDFTTDAYGLHPLAYCDTPYLLTSKQVKHAVLSFGLEMFPPVLNVINNINGSVIKLAKREDVLGDGVPKDLSYYKYATVSEIIFQQQLIDRIEAVHQVYDVKIKNIHADYTVKLDELNNTIKSLHSDYHTQLRAQQQQHEEHMKESLALALKEYQFNIDYPLFTIITLTRPETIEAALRTARSVQQQDYPRFQHKLILIGNADVQTAEFNANSFSLQRVNTIEEALLFAETSLNEPTSDMHCWLEAGSVLLPKALLTVRDIFKRFVEVNWLKGMPVKAGSSKEMIPDSRGVDFRWDRNKFYTSSLAEIGNKLSSGGTFWKKHLWQRAGSNFNKHYLHLADIELFDRMYKTDTLYIVMAYLATANNLYKPSADAEKEFSMLQTTFPQNGSLLSAVSYPFFNRDIPYLRAIHKSGRSYPPLIRFDYHTQSFYLSEY